jgi:cell volume regulation protein A
MLLSFGVTTLLNGSGFLAVYVTAIVLGNTDLPYRAGLRRIHDALAWLSQIGMFLVLGLLVYPREVLDVKWTGLAVAAVLTLLARPAAVWACLWPFKYSPREINYISWVGLRGAVPIILATIPVLSGVEGSSRIFNVVFFVVVINAIIPGTTLKWVTRRLKLDEAEPPAPAAELEITAMQPFRGEIHSYFIDPTLAVSNVALASIRFPANSAVILVVRGQELIAPRGNTVLTPGDHVYVLCTASDRPYVQLLFGRPEADE